MMTFNHLYSTPNPYFWGMGSLGNISGGYVSFGGYLNGNNAADLYRDWQIIGYDMRRSMAGFRF